MPIDWPVEVPAFFAYEGMNSREYVDSHPDARPESRDVLVPDGLEPAGVDIENAKNAGGWFADPALCPWLSSGWKFVRGGNGWSLFRSSHALK